MQKQKPQKDYNQAWSAIQKYCAYQERCHKEVRSRLYEYGLHTEDVEELLYRLIENNYLNEERFARAFAGGKFRVKKWGRLKIKRELEMRAISDYCIRKAMEEIDDDAYIQALEELVDKKNRDYRKYNDFIRSRKITQFCYGKGYESDLIWDVVKRKVED